MPNGESGKWYKNNIQCCCIISSPHSSMASQCNLSINEVDHQQAMMGIWCKKCFHKCAYEEKLKHKLLCIIIVCRNYTHRYHYIDGWWRKITSMYMRRKLNFLFNFPKNNSMLVQSVHLTKCCEWMLFVTEKTFHT